MKFCTKNFAAGFIFASLCTVTVFASGGIKSAAFNDNKVVFDGKALDLSAAPMISVVKEGETSISNYMPVRGVLEAMGFKVDWDSNTKSVIVTSPPSSGTSVIAPPQGANAEEPGIAANMTNPWEICTEDEAFNYLGAKFTINPPAGYKESEIACLSMEFAKDISGMVARLTYTNDNDDMFRVVIFPDGKNMKTEGTPTKVNGIDAYYNNEKNAVTYRQGDYLIDIDMLGKTEAEVMKTVGSVTLAE